MGYRIIYVKNNVSYSVLEENDPDYVLVSAVYHREKRSVGTLTFKLLDNHPSFSVFEKFKGTVYLNFNDKRIFAARIFDVLKDTVNVKTVLCEGLIAYLNDSVIAPYKFNRNSRIFVNAPAKPEGGYSITARDFLIDLLDEHNHQTNEEKHIFLNESSSDILKTEISTENSGFSTAWNELKSKILDNYGGDVDLDLSKADVTLDFIDGQSADVVQEVQYGINLRSIEIGYNDNFATSVRPVSTYIDDDGNSHTIGVASVNAGDYFITYQSAASAYGRINKVLEINGARTPADLFNLSVPRLMEMSKLRMVVSLSAIDMYALDVNYMPIKTSQMIRVISEPHNLNFTAEVTAFDADILNPGNSEYTIDGEATTLTKLLRTKI